MCCFSDSKNLVWENQFRQNSTRSLNLLHLSVTTSFYKAFSCSYLKKEKGLDELQGNLSKCRVVNTATRSSSFPPSGIWHPSLHKSAFVGAVESSTVCHGTCASGDRQTSILAVELAGAYKQVFVSFHCGLESPGGRWLGQMPTDKSICRSPGFLRRASSTLLNNSNNIWVWLHWRG